MTLFTIGYGGRSAGQFLMMLRDHGVRSIVDVRLRPDRASMGIWVKAKTSDKGIERLLGEAGIAYRSLPELGNMFLGLEDWPTRYTELLARAGDLLVDRLEGIAEPYCLLCAEKRVAECHRRQIAEFLARTRGAEVIHLE
jgi:uncharacterized protein (DUF488 family)